jgi:hypothetical protein
MEHRDLLSRRWARVAIAALALFILAGGLCLFELDREHDGMDDHANLLDLCCLALVAPAVAPLSSGLVLCGLATGIMGLALVTAAPSVPSPPPRRARLP